MHIQKTNAVNTEQRQKTVLENNRWTGGDGAFSQHNSDIPIAVTESISAISNEQLSSIDTQDNASVIGHPPKITIVNYQFVISDHTDGLVYNYQVVSVDGAWSISLSGIVG